MPRDRQKRTRRIPDARLAEIERTDGYRAIVAIQVDPNVSVDPADMPSRELRLIAEIVRTNPAASGESLVAQLVAQGIDAVVAASVVREIAEESALKWDQPHALVRASVSTREHARRRRIESRFEQALREFDPGDPASISGLRDAIDFAELSGGAHQSGQIVRLSDVMPERVQWLWPGRIALGRTTLLVGDPGLGKSLASLDIAARVTCGATWPDGSPNVLGPRGVVLVTCEDGIADTVVPRLIAAGGDRARAVSLTLDDLSRVSLIERAIREVGDASLVVVDPISALLGPIDSHKMGEVRALMGRLYRITQATGVALLAVSHLSKGGGTSAVYRITGSLGFVAAARAAYLVARDPSDREQRLYVPIKNNLGRDSEGLRYMVVQQEGADAPCIAWGTEPVSVSADEALGVDQPARKSKRADATEWLRAFLTDNGPTPVADVEREAESAGLSWSTVRRAQQALEITPRKRGFKGPWCWALPNAEVTLDSQGAHAHESERLRSAHDESVGESAKALNSDGVSAFDGGSEHLRYTESPIGSNQGQLDMTFGGKRDGA